MSDVTVPRVAIIDYEMSNVLSVQRACENSGLNAFVTSDKTEVLSADASILPGVGAFGDAMDALRKLDLVDAIYKFVESGKPFMGICLGMQLLMSRSFEFGEHEGLSIVKGDTVIFNEPQTESGEILKVPQVGWNHIHYSNERQAVNLWKDTLLNGIEDGEYMYFVHSYYVMPDDFSIVVSKTRYGNIDFCSSFQVDNIFACQFHPEKSGPKGLEICNNFRNMIYN